MTSKDKYICVNCKSDIVPLPKKEWSKVKQQVLPKFCKNCIIAAPRASMRPTKPRKK